MTDYRTYTAMSIERGFSPAMQSLALASVLSHIFRYFEVVSMTESCRTYPNFKLSANHAASSATYSTVKSP